MKREFTRKFNKFASLLAAAALFLCSFDGVNVRAAYETVAENAAVSEAYETAADGDYAAPQPEAVPRAEDSDGEQYDLDITEMYEVSEGYSDGAEGETEEAETVAETEAETEEETVEEPTESVEEELISAYSGEISAYSYELTEDDLDNYDDTDEYRINNIDDWLKVEALSKVRNFEGKSVTVFTPEDNTSGGKFNLTGTGFTGLGSEEYPFCGKLTTSIFGTSVSCDCPLIAYMSSKATIEQFVLEMSGGNAGIAGTLVFEGDKDTTMLLKGITVTGYLEDSESEGVGGLFGTIINKTEHRLTIDAATVSQSEADQWGGIKMTFSRSDGNAALIGKNVGTFVGNIVGNVEFIVNEDFHIGDASGKLPDLYGTESTGSIVGRMEYYQAPLSASMELSQLSELVGYSENSDLYPMIHFKKWSGFSVDNISGTGYNGGVIGYSDHAKIWNNTENSVLAISDSTISGGKAAGGFIGYAAYTTIDGTGMGEIQITDSTFECSIDTYVKDGINEGIVGGFIGIYGDGNSLFNGIKITVKNLTFTTVNSTESRLSRYMGGLIGKYASANNIEITPESETVSISNIDFKIYATNTYCGGFISYVPSDAGSLYLDTSLYIDTVRIYVPTDCTNRSSVYTTAFGGIASIIDSDNLTVKNIEIKGVEATLGRYLGCVAGKICGEDSVFENLTLSNMTVSEKMDGTSQTAGNQGKSTSGAGAIAGYHKRGATINNIEVTDLSLSPYICSYTMSDNLASEQVGVGGLIGVLGDSDYSITDISNVTISGLFNTRYYYNYYRAYTAGLIGYVYPKTAVCLDRNFDFSGVTSFNTSSTLRYIGKLVGAQREALIYMEPTCEVTYNEDVFANMDELGSYGGIYRNETFWDDAEITKDSVSAEDGTYIIEKDDTSDSGIKINGSVKTYDDGWGLSTMGDYMRFTIVNNTIGYYGLECFGAAEYDDIAGGTFTALNDIDLSARYMGVLTLNRNDNAGYNSSYFHYARYTFYGVFKGIDGEKTRIILPNVTVYNQANTGGLFAVVTGAEFRNLSVGGTIDACRSTAGYITYSGYPYNGAGALAAIANNRVTVEDVDIDGLTVNTYVGEGYMSAGSLFGNCRYYTLYSSSNAYYIEGKDYKTTVNDKGNTTPTYHWDSSIKNVTVKDSEIHNYYTGGTVYLGGLVGRWFYQSSTSQTVDFDNVNLKNTDIYSDSTVGSIGGLVSYTESTESYKLTFNFNDVKIDEMDINSASNGNQGGFWGYYWTHTDVNLDFTNNTDKVVVNNSNLNVTATGTGTQFGGMIYDYRYSMLNADNGLVIKDTHISAPNSTQSYCSFFISQASTLLLMLKDYRLKDTSVAFNGTQFDEVAGYTKNNKSETSQQLNMGIVSLSDSENPFCLTEEGFHVYEYQSDYTNCPKLKKPYYNPYTRYYYNLDEVADKVAENPITTTTITYNGTARTAYDIKTPEQLLMWHILMTIYTNTSGSTCRYMMRYFKDCFDGDITSTYDTTLRERQLKITGKLDMSGLSIYPTAISPESSLSSARIVAGADFDNENAGSGANGIIFDYDGINLGTAKSRAAGKDCVVLRSTCTTSGYVCASQHSLMHCGLFGNDSAVNVMSDISFGGSVGTLQYSTTARYSGAAFCGLLQSKNTEMRFENITLDGLFVVNPNEDYLNNPNGGSLENWQNYYGMLLGGWNNNQNSIFFDKIETKNYGAFLAKYPNKKAASALIGRVGDTSLASLKKFEFSNMSIADAEETDVLEANGTTLEKIKATEEDQIMAYASYVYSYQYSSAEQGFYNFDDVCYFYGNGQFDPPSGDKYYITLGKELGSDIGETKTEYYNTSSKVGEASYDETKAADNDDYQNFTESAVDKNYWLAFSNLNYKPYIYNYAERYINVNYKSGDLLEGCGTYEDPYIISNERQLYSLYCYLAPGGLNYTSSKDYDVSTTAAYTSSKSRYPQYNSGFKTKLNEWKVNIPGTDDEMCDGETHEYLTYDYEANPVSGFDDRRMTPDSTTDIRMLDDEAKITVNLLRNAYYKITADIDMSDYEDFYGLCHFDPSISTDKYISSYFPFTGVIIGEKADGSAPVIKMPNFKKFSGSDDNMVNFTFSYGFVAAAKGCVLKNLDIQYPEDGYAKLGYSTNSTYIGIYTFGGAIGNIWGGDNIIDNVRVSGSVMVDQTSVSSGTANRNYMGGLVGGLWGGGLILRNLSTDDFSDFDFKLATSTSVVLSPPSETSYTGALYAAGADYDYINGVIGRVLDAYAIVESVDDETLDVSDDKAVIDFSEYDETAANKLHAQNSYSLINANYFKDAGKVKITRNGYDFETEISNAKQLFLYAQTMNSGGFFTAAGSSVNKTGSYSSYGTELYHSINNLSHVYHCGSSYIWSSYDSENSYDVYSRCRKAKYDSVGKEGLTADNGDYQNAKKYDNILTEEYFKTDITDFKIDSYKNYIGYNYMVANYFDFYEGNAKDEFWIMRRSGIYNAEPKYGTSQSVNQCNKMYNIYNVYGGTENVDYQGRTSLTLVNDNTNNGEYDMTPFKNAFRGIGSFWESPYSVKTENSSTFNGSVDGQGSTVILDMDLDSGGNYAGLFTRLYPGFGNYYASGGKELYPLYEIKDLNLTGSANAIYTAYRGYAARAGLLCGYINYGRYKITNVNVKNASAGAYSNAGGLIGYFENNTQLIMENCTAEKVKLTNEPEGAKNYSAGYLGGIFGYLSTYSLNYGNNAYITNCSVSDISCDIKKNTGTINFGGFIGNGSNLYYLNMYNNSAKNISADLNTGSSAYVGGIVGYFSNGNEVDMVNTTVEGLSVSEPSTSATGVYAGGAFGYFTGVTNILMRNTCISDMTTALGATEKRTTDYYFQTSSANSVGGLAGRAYNIGLHLDGVYIEGVKPAESEISLDGYAETNGLVTSAHVIMTQKVQYSGGLIGYLSGQSSNGEYSIRLVSMGDDDADRVTATPTPKPTTRPQYDGGEIAYPVPDEPENPHKGDRNYIKNCELMAQYTGGLIGYVNNNSGTSVNTENKSDWLIEDTDITENKIVGNYTFKTNTTTESGRYDSSYYIQTAGGMFGYVYYFYRSDLYSSDVNIEHNVIGTTQNAPSLACSGGIYGYVVEGNNNNVYGGFSNYLYNTTLKNNYIGPLNLIKDEDQYYPTSGGSSVYKDWAYKFIYKLWETYNQIRDLSIDELGAYTRLYVDGEMVDSESWDYDVTEPNGDDRYAQDNLYKYAKNVGLFIGYNSQTASTNKRFHIFIVAPDIIYDGTVYKDANGDPSTSDAHRPAADVGSTAALSADDDMYAYREYTHIVYNDANDPTAYGEWDESVANDVVPAGLGYSDNHDYLFAQLSNIYDDYKEQINGDITDAEYDKTAHTYRLKDNYGQTENGYTMDEVYDYIYYGYERDVNGVATSDTPDYLSPYTDEYGKVIPMLVYKAQYGTPDLLMNTIINILTNNAGAYNTNVGYFNANTVSILKVESWKMQLTDGVAEAVYDDDGNHKPGGFAVESEDNLPSPTPSSTAAPKPQVRSFALSHTSYDVSKDEQNGTFTVLHITYGWIPSNMKFNGSVIECSSVMTLDIPVYVSKLLEVQINMKTLDGVQLSESVLAEQGSEAGTVVLKTTNTVMAEYVYDYPRTMYDEVCLKKKLTFEMSPGYIYLYKGTKLTLIDVTDHDKVYYYYVDKDVPNPQIPFEEFVDADGNNYVTRDVSKVEDYPKLGTADSPYTDLRGQTWGGKEGDEGFINDYGVGIERFIIIIDKSATAIDATDRTAYTLHSIHVRVDDENTSEKLMQRIRYDGKDYENTEVNKPTEDCPNPDWYGVAVDGYMAYNYVTIREIDTSKVNFTSGTVSEIYGLDEEHTGIGAGYGLDAKIEYSITASSTYWTELSKTNTKWYLDFVISIERDGKEVALPVGAKFSLSGYENDWYTIGEDYEYGKKKIYYYADRAKKAEEAGNYNHDFKFLINDRTTDVYGTMHVFFDFRGCDANSFSDGNYVVRVDAYKTTNSAYPESGDYQDTWRSDVYSVYNSNGIGFALQEDDLLYRGINRYLPKVSDNGVIDYKAQIDFREYLDEETGEIKDVVTNQFYTIGIKVMKKNNNGTYEEYTDDKNRFKFYYDKAKYEGTGYGNYDGTVDSDDPLAYGYDDTTGEYCGGVTYKFTVGQLNNGSSIPGVAELAFRLVYDTKELESKDFSNYKFIAYLYLSDNSASGNTIPDGSSEVLTKEQIDEFAKPIVDPLSDHLIFTLARLKTD